MDNIEIDPGYIAGYLSAALETAEHQRGMKAAETLRDAIHVVLAGIYAAQPWIGEFDKNKDRLMKQEQTNHDA